jgi:hypothetical protein
MRFSYVVSRYAPATNGQVTIGSDTLNLYQPKPTVQVHSGNQNLDATDAKLGCVLVARSVNLYGRPIQRVAVGFVPPQGSSYPAGNLTGMLYVLEETTGTWHACPVAGIFGTQLIFVPNQLAWFDIPVMGDYSNVNTNDPGKLYAFLLVSSSGVGALPPGNYQFPMGADFSNPGT